MVQKICLTLIVLLLTVDSSRSEDVLEIVARENVANKSSIRTWKGRASIEDEITRSGDLEYRIAFDVDFLVDKNRDAYRYDSVTTDAVTTVEGGQVKVDTSSERGLVLGKDFYRLGPFPSQEDGERPTPRVVRVGGPEQMRIAPVSKDFSPEYYFTAHGMDVDERFLHFHQQSLQGTHWKTVRDGSKVSVESSENVGVNRFVVDLDKGANIVEMYMSTLFENGELELETMMTWDWINISGVYVPARFSYRKTNLKKQTTFTRQILWQGQDVNFELEGPDALTVASLGVRPLDIVMDTVSGTQFSVPDPTVGTPVDEPFTPPKSKWFLWLNLLVIVALAVWFGVKQRLRKQSSTSSSR